MFLVDKNEGEQLKTIIEQFRPKNAILFPGIGRDAEAIGMLQTGVPGNQADENPVVSLRKRPDRRGLALNHGETRFENKYLT